MISKKVLVAMSGGIDSSITAVLLKEQGYQVVGITMKLMPSSNSFGGCCGIDAIEDAKKVANMIGIPHYVLNLKELFNDTVIKDFCSEYINGRTPNPCIRCNKYLKFEALLQKAQELGLDYIATGHYARIQYDKGKKQFFLKKAIDTKKDQSYALYIMGQEQLKRTLFPLGNITKEKVKKIAIEMNLPVANKPESQEICFIPDNNYPIFVREYTKTTFPPGNIINKEGKILGQHKGIINYTIGQRKGLGIGAPNPLYVTAINIEDNTITVGEKDDTLASNLIAKDIIFVSGIPPEKPVKIHVKIRYNDTETKALLSPLKNGKVSIQFDKPKSAITPGQAVVFYKKDIVMGGGTIERQDIHEPKSSKKD